MVFSSIPAYLDPSNWQQQPSHQIRGEGSSAIIQLNQQNPQLLPPPPPPPPRPPPPLSQPQHPHVIGGGGSGGGGGVDNMISPRSMSERARLANIPIPEAALNCPRCESTNTKFCYFNNYNLTQPRHFCKTCRRYWTRGGALRSVPVGGGCRRNKRSKNTTTNSKSMSTSSTDRHTPSSSTSTISSYSGGGGGGGRPTANTLLDLTHHLPSSHMAFSSPLGQLSDQSGVNNFNYSSSNSFLMGDHHPSSHHEMNYQMGCNNLLGSGSLEQWRLNHLQLLGGLNNNNNNCNSSSLGNGLYQFQTVVPLSGFVGDTSRDQVIIRDQNKPSNSVLLNHHHHQHQQQLDSITTTTKMEENQGLTRNLMGNPTNNAWTGGGGGGGGGGATWSDYLTRFSTRNP